MVLADEHFGLHEGEDAVFWEGGEEVACLLAGQDLDVGQVTS